MHADKTFEIFLIKKFPPFKKGGPGGISARQARSNPPHSPFHKGGGLATDEQNQNPTLTLRGSSFIGVHPLLSAAKNKTLKAFDERR
jgi:hypothetical protein